MFTSVHIIIFSITSIVTASEIADGDREARLLNVFSIVKFPNSACNTTGGNYYANIFMARKIDPRILLCLVSFIKVDGRIKSYNEKL